MFMWRLFNPLFYLCGVLEIVNRKAELPQGKGISSYTSISCDDDRNPKKLYLVLDLDHTLLNSCFISEITSSEKQYFNHSFPDTLFKIDRMKMMTKVRPFVPTFLKEASHLFHMCIYTMGDRRYALQMAKLLDPEEIYFSKIISRDDCMEKKRKTLDVVPGQENAVIIVDDNERMWEKHKDNLINIGRYHYFASSCRHSGLHRKSFSQERCDESETEGQLAAVLEILKRIHALFFDDEYCKLNSDDRDVRKVIKTFDKKIKRLQEKPTYRQLFRLIKSNLCC